MIEPGSIACTMSRVINKGALRPGTAAVVITTSCSFRTRAICSRWRWIGFFIESTRVAALALSLDAEIDIDELRAQAFDLLLHSGAHVVAADDGAQTARGGDGLEAGDARSDHQDPRRGHGAGGGGHHGEQAVQRGGRQKHGFVSGDGGHRGKRVHTLRAGDARDKVHGKERRAGAGVGGGDGRVGQRIAEADREIPRLDSGRFLRHADVKEKSARRRGPRPRRAEMRALGCVIHSSRKAGVDAGIALRSDLHAGFLQHVDHARSQRHPALRRKMLLENPCY